MTLSLFIPVAHAQNLGINAAQAVGGFLGAAGGFGDIAALVANNAMPFVNAAAILTIVIAGMLAIIAQDENRIANARKVVVMTLAGIVLINIAARIGAAFITAFNFDQGADASTGASILSTEIFGLINFAESFVAIFAIITIIVYGIKALVDFGGEQGIAAFRKAVLSVMLGILIISVKFIIAGSILTGNPGGIIHPAVRTLFAIVTFVALIAVVVIAAAGIYLIVNLADENRAQKARNVIISVAIGIIFMTVIASLLAILINAIFGI